MSSNQFNPRLEDLVVKKIKESEKITKEKTNKSDININSDIFNFENDHDDSMIRLMSETPDFILIQKKDAVQDDSYLTTTLNFITSNTSSLYNTISNTVFGFDN